MCWECAGSHISRGDVELGYCFISCFAMLCDYLCGHVFLGREGRSEEMLDSENQHRVDGLSGKVSRLKEVC